MTFNLYRPLFTVAVLLLLAAMHAHGATVRGRVTDEAGVPVPFTSIYAKGTQKGCIANGNGEYVLQLEAGSYTIVFSSLGYEQQAHPVKLAANDVVTIDVRLKTALTSLHTVEVVADTRDKGKEIMKEVRDRRAGYMANLEAYSVDIYLKTIVDRQELEPVSGDSIDSTQVEIVWKDSLPIAYRKKERTDLIEANSTLYVKGPDRVREMVHAYESHERKHVAAHVGRSSSVRGDPDFNPLPKDDLVEMSLESDNPYIIYPDNQSVNFHFYRDLIDWPIVCQKPLLSPIASTSAMSYVYDYEGAFMQGEQRIFKLRVKPILSSEALFYGHIYIADSSFALVSVDLYVNESALFMCETLHIQEEYGYIDSSVYMPVMRSVRYEIKDAPHRYYAETDVHFNQYQLQPEIPSNFFNGEVITYDAEAFDRDTVYWVDRRPELLDASEIRFIDESDSIDLYLVSDAYYAKIDSAFNRIDWWSPLVGVGHRNRARGTEWYVEGLLGQINPLGVGGYRHQLPVYFTKTFANDMELEAQLRPNIGTYNLDFKMKGGVGLTYFPKKFVRTYVRFGDFYERINPSASFEQIFARSNFINATTFSISQRMEIINGLFAELTYKYSDQKPITNLSQSAYERLIFGEEFLEPLPFERYVKSEFVLDVQYRIRQKYFIRGNKKIIVGSDFPNLFLSYRKGIPGLFNSEVNFDYLEVGASDDLRLRRLGTVNWRVYGGSFLNDGNLRVLEYKYLRGSDRWFFSDPTRSLQLLGPTFNTRYPFLQANYIQHFEGAIMNKIPLVNKLRLELAAGGAALYVNETNFAQVELFAGLERPVRIKKQLFRFGAYAVTADNNVDALNITYKFGINYFNTFTNKWDY